MIRARETRVKAVDKLLDISLKLFKSLLVNSRPDIGTKSRYRYKICENFNHADNKADPRVQSTRLLVDALQGGFQVS